MSTPERDPLAMIMLAAWLNVRPDQIPEVNRAHTCEASMIAWKRVGDAAVAYVQGLPKASEELALSPQNSAVFEQNMAERNSALQADLKAHCEAVATCESCMAPLFDGDDFFTETLDGCSGCWDAMTDAPNDSTKSCYAYRVGLPHAGAKASDGESGR